MSFRKFIQPLAYLVKGDMRFYYYWKNRHNLSLKKNEMVQLQKEKLKKLITHSYASVPFYREYFKKNNLHPKDFSKVSDLEKLPIMTKEIMKNNLDRLKGIGTNSLTKVTSGGSTGETAVVYKTHKFIQMSRASDMRNLVRAGWNYYDKSVWIWGAPYEHQKVRESLISKIGIYINGRLLLNAYNYSPDDFPVWAEKIDRFKPKILYGYASIILEFAKWCVDNNVNYESIKAVISTTEKLKGREFIEKAFQCKVYDQYACREVLPIAVECEKGNMHIADDSVIVEQIEDNNLLITALDSFGFPIIRYRIGDTGKIIDKECSCDLNLSLMDLEIGRITDNFIRPNRKKIASSSLATYISTLDINFTKYQLIQKKINEFEVKFISYGETTEIDKEKFTKALEKYFNKVKIDFTPVVTIPCEPSGKRLLFKCLIKDD